MIRGDPAAGRMFHVEHPPRTVHRAPGARAGQRDEIRRSTEVSDHVDPVTPQMRADLTRPRA